MLRTIVRLEKLAALRRRFLQQGMLIGSTAGYIYRTFSTVNDNVDDISMDTDTDSDTVSKNGYASGTKSQDEERLCDVGPDNGPRALSSIVLASTPGMF